MKLMNNIRKDLFSASRTILKHPTALMLPVAALAQGLILNGAVILAAKNAGAIKQAANYVAFLIAQS